MPPADNIKISVSVRDHQGRNHDIRINPDAPVTKLKKKVEKRSGIPSRNLRLITGSKQMQDGLTITDYAVMDKCVIRISLRLHGG